MKRTSKLLSILFIGLAGAAPSNACTINIIPTNFGIYQPIDPSPNNATGEIYIKCPLGSFYNIMLDGGTSSTGYFPRQMIAAPGSTLAYNLYTDVGHSLIWGDGTYPTNTKSGAGTGSTEILTIYGQIPGNQNVIDGVYTDTIVVTVEF